MDKKTKVIPLKPNARAIRRLALKEIEKIYYITGGFMFPLQDPELREIWEFGLHED